MQPRYSSLRRRISRASGVCALVSAGLSFLVAGAAAANASSPLTVIVTPGQLLNPPTAAPGAGQFDVIDQTGGTGGGSVGLVSGPGTSPNGSGSLQMETASGSSHWSVYTNDWAGTPLSSITTLSYSTYTIDNTTQDAALQVVVDPGSPSTAGQNAGCRASSYSYSTLNFEPYLQPGGVVDGTWQTWNVLADGGVVWGTHIPCAPPAYSGLDWSTLLTYFPNAAILPIAAGGGVGVNVGGGWPAITTNVATLSVGTASGGVTDYEFEPSITPTLTLSGSPLHPGTNTYTATLTVPAGAPAPTEGAIVTDDGTGPKGPGTCTAALTGGGTSYSGSCTIKAEKPGTTVSATYDADGLDLNYTEATSGTLTITPPGPPPPPPPPGPHTVYVAQGASPNASDTSCGAASYSSVQAALNAVTPGGTVYLCDTTPFVESVVITQSVTLTGVSGATIQSPGAPSTTFFSSQGLETPNSVVTVLGNANVTINGLTLEGPFNNAGCGGDDFGILQLGTGQLQISNDVVENIGAADQAGLGGCQYGVAIQIGREYWPEATGSGYATPDFPGNAQIIDTTVSGYQKNGVTADGPGTYVQINGLTANGGGPTDLIARNGIQISRGATGQVQNSYIFGNEYTGNGDAADSGILVYGGCGDPLSTNVHITNNVLVNNDASVVLDDLSPSCTTSATSPTNNRVANNLIVKSDGDTNQVYQAGIAVVGDGDQIQNNTILGTVVGSTDTAFGPATSPVFLQPIDLSTPPIDAQLHNNTFDGTQLPNSGPPGPPPHVARGPATGGSTARRDAAIGRARRNHLPLVRPLIA